MHSLFTTAASSVPLAIKGPTTNSKNSNQRMQRYVVAAEKRSDINTRSLRLNSGLAKKATGSLSTSSFRGSSLNLASIRKNYIEQKRQTNFNDAGDGANKRTSRLIVMSNLEDERRRHQPWSTNTRDINQIRTWAPYKHAIQTGGSQFQANIYKQLLNKARLPHDNGELKKEANEEKLSIDTLHPDDHEKLIREHYARFI